MTLLLDTHVLLWFAVGDRRLGARARRAVASGDVLVSAISVWEMGVKQRLGRLDVTALQERFDDLDFPDLPFTAPHARDAAALQLHHKDPFDRALVGQARVDGLVLVSGDHQLERYDVALLDALR